jgi:hypothetical protein
VQAWVALPQAYEETDPAFFHHAGADLPTFEQRDARGRLIAGEAFGMSAKVRTHSPLFYIHWELDSGAKVQLPAEHRERAVYVVAGSIETDGRLVNAGRMVVFAEGQAALATASAPSIVMALGGAPVGPRFIEWNFVSSSQERVEQAKADWRAGRMKLPDLDHDEFIAYP